MTYLGQYPQDFNKEDEQLNYFLSAGLPLPQSKTKQEEKEIGSIYEINNENLVVKVTYYLRGYYFDEVTRKWNPLDEKEPEKYRKMNQRGIADMAVVLSPFTDKNLLLSVFDIIQIHKLCVMVQRSIRNLFVKNWQVYELDPSKANMMTLMTVIISQVYSTLLRALNGGERKHREKQMHFIEQTLLKENIPKRSMFNFRPGGQM